MATRKQRQKAAKKRQGSTKPGKNAKRQRTRAQKKSRRRPKGKANKQRRTAGAKPPMPSRRPATSGKDTAKMNDYFGGMSPKDLEDLARRLIEQGPEGHKVDFKVALNLSGNAEKAEFAKDVSSIANTDDEVHLDDFGYLIVGAKRNQLLGGVAELAGNTDKLQADLTDVLKNFLLPVPSFSVVAFNDPTLGPWGVLVVQPSVRQPHIFIRDGA